METRRIGRRRRYVGRRMS